MPTFTAQQLIDRAKAAADMHDDFVTETQWLSWLSVEVTALEVMVARAGYVLRESVSTVTANGAASYPLASVQAIIGVYRNQNNRLVRLRAADPFTRMRQHPNAVDTGDAQEFYVSASTDAGMTLQFYPRPTSGTYYVWYIPTANAVTSPLLQLTYPLGWEERLVLRLAKRARIKEESDTSALDREIAEIDRHIEESVWSRLLAQTPSVRNVDKVERDSIFARWPSVNDWIFM